MPLQYLSLEMHINQLDSLSQWCNINIKNLFTKKYPPFEITAIKSSKLNSAESSSKQIRTRLRRPNRTPSLIAVHGSSSYLAIGACASLENFCQHHLNFAIEFRSLFTSEQICLTSCSSSLKWSCKLVSVAVVFQDWCSNTRMIPLNETYSPCYKYTILLFT